MAFGVILLAGYSGSPERARWLHLARSVSQSQRAIWVILPARGASHTINTSYATLSGGIPWNILLVTCTLYSGIHTHLKAREYTEIKKLEIRI